MKGATMKLFFSVLQRADSSPLSATVTEYAWQVLRVSISMRRCLLLPRSDDDAMGLGGSETELSQSRRIMSGAAQR